MNIYFAPLEGLTDSTFRQLHHKYFPGIQKYFTPFLSPTVHRCLTERERRELSPADTLNAVTVPQVLTKNADDFLWLAQIAADFGYAEINLNLGCPSGTVVAKGKGAGMLADTDALDCFLNKIYKNAPIAVSVKTRLGLETPEEFYNILSILNRYPVSELTLHPRVRKQFYKGLPDIDAFSYCMKNSKSPVCYNGNLYSVSDAENLMNEYPKCNALMVGRGLIADPGMFSGGTKRETLQAFYDELTECYLRRFGSERNTLFRLKENWFYLLAKFENSEKLGKRLRKTTSMVEYKAITREIFDTLPMRETISPNW